uniref:PHD-type domain-containing protein n=1 Tax=Anopheles dirus TaxID=7168 RepID=A0A182NX01_9DIPT
MKSPEIFHEIAGWVGSCQLCQKEHTSEDGMRECYECDRWLHIDCAKLTQRWHCPK